MKYLPVFSGGFIHRKVTKQLWNNCDPTQYSTTLLEWFCSLSEIMLTDDTKPSCFDMTVIKYSEKVNWLLKMGLNEKGLQSK